MRQICKCFYKYISKPPDTLKNYFDFFFSKSLSDCFKFIIVTIYINNIFLVLQRYQNTQPTSSSTLSTSAHSRFPQHSKSCQSCHFHFTPCLCSNVSLKAKINLQYGSLNAAFFTKVKPICQ